MSKTTTKHGKRLYRCRSCGQGIYLEKREFKGLVLTCACGQLQNVKTDSMLPQEWSA